VGELLAVNDGFALETCCGRTERSRLRKARESVIRCSHLVGAPPENHLCIPLSAQGAHWSLHTWNSPRKQWRNGPVTAYFIASHPISSLPI